MGKSLGSDLAEGKQTFMVIKARNLFPKKWKEIIIDSKSVDVVKNCKLFFDEKGIIEKTRIKAESYFESARENLKQIKSIDTGELLKFINLIEERTF
jgi:geranylgeranyl pyrophosphate synthase